MNVSNLKSDLWKKDFEQLCCLNEGGCSQDEKNKLLLSCSLLPTRSSFLLGPGTIAFNPGFGSFILLELVSNYVNQFLW
jgi:hypothetical protein